MGRVPDRHAAEVAMTDPMVPQPHVGQHRGTYGIDAPYVPLLLGIGGLTMLGVTALNVLRHAGPLPVVWCALVSLVMLGSTASYLYTTRAGKFAIWARLLKQLHLRGDGAGPGHGLWPRRRAARCGSACAAGPGLRR